jgi:hypothetical protein
VADFLVVQQRDYRMHRIEVTDRGGKAGCTVVVHPPSPTGGAWEVPAEGAAVTLGERLNRAKALIDVVMGPRPTPRRQHAARRDR